MSRWLVGSSSSSTVGVFHQQRRQPQPRALAARQRAHGVVFAPPKAEGQRHARLSAAALVAAAPREVFQHRRMVLDAFMTAAAHGRRCVVEFAFERVEVGKRRFQHLVDGRAFREHRILRQRAHPHIVAAYHCPGVRNNGPGQHFQQRTFARSVAPDQRQAVARLDLKRDVAEHRAGSVILDDILKTDKHAWQYTFCDKSSLK